MRLFALLFIVCLFGAFAPAQVPTPPSNATWLWHLDDNTGWKKCGGGCANVNDPKVYWFKQGVSSPSIDGKAMEAYIEGCYDCWADDLFYYHLGAQNWATHMEYKFNFQWNAPKTKQSNGHYVVQGMEFDAFWSENSFKYNLSSQCSYYQGYWGLWDPVNADWKNISVPCPRWAPGSWHQIIWYVTRDPIAKTSTYVGLEVDGKQYWINHSTPALWTSWDDSSGVQFEQDTDRDGDPWYMWVDQVAVALW